MAPNAGDIVAVNEVQTQEPSTGIGAVDGAVPGGLLDDQAATGAAVCSPRLPARSAAGSRATASSMRCCKTTTYQVQVRMSPYRSRNGGSMGAENMSTRGAVRGRKTGSAGA